MVLFGVEPLSFTHSLPSSSPPRPVRLLIGLSGSVAAVKLPNLLTALFELQDTDQYRRNNTRFDIKIISTQSALHFFSRDQLPRDPSTNLPVPFLTDTDEWTQFTKIGDPVLHIDLRAWADLLLIAPLDANTLAKVSLGLCDNLLTCTVRAWDPAKPLVVCPAMNTVMWEHPTTAEHLTRLQNMHGRYLCYVPPIEKTLACGDTGCGAMQEVHVIVKQVLHDHVERLLRLS